MKKEIKDKWVKALESGKYKQAKGKLSFVDCYRGIPVFIIKRKWFGLRCYIGIPGIKPIWVWSWHIYQLGLGKDAYEKRAEKPSEAALNRNDL